MRKSVGDVRRRLQKAALELYRERGFDKTTAADIAARVGVTERTFFRYFPDKREVLFDETALKEGLTAAIANVPETLPPLQAVLWAFASLEPLFEANRPLAELGREVITNTPALAERQLAKTASIVQAIAGALEGRGVDPKLASLAASSGMALVSHAIETWFDDPSNALAAHLENAHQRLKGLVEITLPASRKR